MALEHPPVVLGVYHRYCDPRVDHLVGETRTRINKLLYYTHSKCLCRARFTTPPNHLPKRPHLQSQHKEKPTRANAGSDGADGGSGATNGGGAPTNTPAGTARATENQRNALVQRIALHLKGARILVALAPRLDTPTAAVTAAAVAAAAATVKAKEAKDRRAAGAAAGMATPDNAMNEARIDDYLDEENLRDQSPDAEVLPRGWQITDGAPVYLRNRSLRGMNRGSVGGCSSPHYPRRDDGAPQAQRGDGSPYLRRDAQGGAGDGLRFGDRRRRRSGEHEGGGGATNNRSSTDAGPAAGEHGDLHSKRGIGQIRWREITKESFDLLLVVDGGAELGSSRTLLAMPEYGSEEQDRARREGRRPGGLYICPTMAEYYLLLSVYFGEGNRGGREWRGLCAIFGKDGMVTGSPLLRSDIVEASW